MTDPKGPGLVALLELDRLVHEPARLAILTVLASAEEVQFKFLEEALGLTRGSLRSLKRGATARPRGLAHEPAGSAPA